jgi:hypothetical protein
MEEGGVAWVDFLKFLELFFNGEIWYGKMWLTCLLNFQKYFLMEKDDMAWKDVTYLHVKGIEINDLKWVIEI